MEQRLRPSPAPGGSPIQPTLTLRDIRVLVDLRATIAEFGDEMRRSATLAREEAARLGILSGGDFAIFAPLLDRFDVLRMIVESHVEPMPARHEALAGAYDLYFEARRQAIRARAALWSIEKFQSECRQPSIAGCARPARSH
ncbi:MAG: hypothetical protein IBJ15_16990 [Alphaproteobacteria bacterium]|nr:hypothetical protein [Alphaproteobacteria bacterium]